MSTHIEARCERPKLYRYGRSRPKRVVGDLWACDCGQVWRVTLVSGFESTFLGWREFNIRVTTESEADRG